MAQNIQKDFKKIDDSNYFVNLGKIVFHVSFGDSEDVALRLKHLKADSALDRKDSQKELNEKLDKLESTGS